MNKSYEFIVESKKEDIDFINKIIEAYEGIGVVRTIDPINGIISIITTTHIKNFVKEIIEDLDAKWVKAKIIRENTWKGFL